MYELKEIVDKKLVSMTESGQIEQIISDNIEETIKKSLKNALEGFSAFGKAVKEQIETSLQTAGRNVDLPNYNQFIAQIISEQFVKVLKENAVTHLTGLVEKIIEPINKQEKISTLLNEIQELWGDLARENGDDQIVIESDENEEETALYVIFKGPQYEGDVKASFYNFERDEGGTWHIGYINEDGNRVTGRSANQAKHCTNQVTDLLFKYYCMGTEFELDTDIESIYLDY